MQIRSRIVARKFKSDDPPDLYARTPPLEALKSINSTAANHKETCSVVHIDVSREYFHAKAQRLVLVRSTVEDKVGADAGKSGLLKKRVCMAHGTRQATGSVIGKSTSKTGDTRLDSARRLSLFRNRTADTIRRRKDWCVSKQRIKALNRMSHWGERGIAHQHDPRRVDEDLSTATPCEHQQRMMRQKKSQSRWIKFSTASTGRRLQFVFSSATIERTKHSL